MARSCRHIWVRGRVQGVAFRWSTAARARELGVDGWVRNLADGRVEGWIEGPPDAIDAMLAWLAHGPDAARVDDLDVQTESPQDHDGFEILSTARS